MAANRTAIILQAAKKLLMHLPEPLNSELKSLLDRGEKGENVAIDIIELLSEQENIRLWMKEQIASQSGTQTGGTRGFGSLAGKPSSVSSSQTWICSKSGCNESFPVIQEDENPPVCDIHQTVMIRARKKQG